MQIFYLKKRFKTIANNLEGYIRGSRATKNHSVYQGCGVKIDIHLKLINNEIEIYELKKGSVGPLDVYQRLMYWDGFVTDNSGKPPGMGILAGKEAPDSVRTMISLINERKDFAGNKYNIEFKKLEEFGLSNI